MKRHSTTEVAAGVVVCIVMMVGCAIDTWRNAQEGALGWFVVSLAATAFFAAIIGWILIDAFNRMQRRRRLAEKR